MGMDVRAHIRCHGGTQVFAEHASEACGGPMRFSVFLPPAAEHQPVPVLYWLSGLTCTEENFVIKAGAQRAAAAAGLAVVAPDTSPRATGTPGEDDDWDLGTGAGFYVDATAEPWSAHYRMYSWITRELPAVVAENFPVDAGREGISGHSMGGHGALVCALREPGRYRSLSAFAPICAPTRCPWGEKAFTAYLGPDREPWAAWDACELIGAGARPPPLLVDQGLADEFLESQLKPDALEAACEATGTPLTLRRHEGYDHSYYFISSFIDDHIAHHAARLVAA